LEDAVATIQSRLFNFHHRHVIASSEPKGESLVCCCEALNLPVGEAHQFARAGKGEASMNHSIYSADRSTHLKIVVVALVAGIAVAAFGISARTTSDEYAQTARVMKAGTAVAVSSSSTSMVR